MISKVTLRNKPISKGRKSLYLDFYPPIKISGSEKTTRREFLKLSIYAKPNNPIQKQDNKQTLLLAEQIRLKRDNEINKPEIYTPFELEQLKAQEIGEKSFLNYYESQMKKRKGSTYQVWLSTLTHLKKHADDNIKFKDIDEKFCNDFKDYLLHATRIKGNKKLNKNTSSSYFNKFKSTLKQAFKDGYLSIDLNSKIQTIKEAETRREFLTLQELELLANTRCKNTLLRKFAIFSALTGLGFKEVQNMIWKDITYEENQGYIVITKRQKTQRDNYLPIPDQAYELLGEPGEPDQKVIEGLKYSAYHNRQLLDWLDEAGIEKRLTPHCFRHTYATLQLQAGTNLYTISKMLGHSYLKTTQIYAKIIDQTKRDTVDKIKLNLKFF